MSARTRQILGAAVAAALGAALPAHAADRLGGAEDDRLGAVLDDIFAPDKGGLFEQSARGDDRTEQAARLCLDHGAEKVRDNGGDEVRIDRLIDAESDGDKVRLRANMSADYDGDRRSAEVECEVGFEGHNEVTAFRQIGAGSGALDRNLGRDDRTEQAARLCLDHAADKVHDNGGDDVRIDRLVDAESDGDKVRLRADMSADYDGDRRSAEVECEVDFEGDNEVTDFRQIGEAGTDSFDNVLSDILGQD